MRLGDAGKFIRRPARALGLEVPERAIERVARRARGFIACCRPRRSSPAAICGRNASIAATTDSTVSP